MDTEFSLILSDDKLKQRKGPEMFTALVRAPCRWKRTLLQMLQMQQLQRTVSAAQQRCSLSLPWAMFLKESDEHG